MRFTTRTHPTRSGRSMGRSRRSTPRCPGGLPAANTDWTTDPTFPVGDLQQIADAEVEQPTSGPGPSRAESRWPAMTAVPAWSPV
jgi:hypothetical protein